MSILAWIVLGLIAGFIASKIYVGTGQGILMDIVLGIVGAASAPMLRMVAVAMSLPLLFVFVPTLFASFYVSYRDVFHANETLAPLSRGGS